MPGSALSFQRRFFFVATVSAALILIVFAVTRHIPFRIEADIAYAAKSAQEYVAGSADFNRIKLVDPRDLSNDSETWIYWWPPAIATAFIILLKLGLSLSAAARVLMLGAALVGGIGWALVSAMMFQKRITLALAPLPSLFYVVQNSMFLSFTDGDVFVFPIMPWLFALTIYIIRGMADASSRRLLLLIWTTCLLLGLLYWLKFSALFGAAALWATLALATIRNYSPQRALWYLTVGSAIFATPILILWGINQSLGGDIVQSHMSLGGANHVNIAYATFKALSGSVLPIGPGAERILQNDNATLKGWLVYLPGLALLLLTIIATFDAISLEFGALASLLVMVPIAGLIYLTSRANYAFILDANRHGSPYWIFLQLLLIALLTRDLNPKEPRRKFFRGAIIGLTVYCCSLAAFIPYVTLKLALHIPRSGACPPTGLYIPTLSEADPAAVAIAIRDIIRPDDVVVPATYWNGQETWLELPGRLLPLTNFWEPLMQTHGRGGADFFSSEPFRSSRPVRVILIAPDPYLRTDYQESVARIKARFPQVRHWSPALLLPADHIQVWVANLVM
jgi:hypothetical protein